MSDDSPTGPILTLEPLAEAVRAGASRAGWEFSGMQKTTSTEFDGRWEGEETRSAYLFFHHPEVPACSVDVFLDESERGIRGNLALVADVRPLWEVPSVPNALGALGRLAERHLPGEHRRPVTLRLRLADPEEDPVEADLQTRIKLILPKVAIDAGGGAVAALVSATLAAYGALLGDPEAAEVLDLGGAEDG